MRAGDPGRRRPTGRWGELPGGAGVGIVAGSALLGALITIVLRQDPGAPLGVILILGTLAAGLGVRSRSVRLIIPAPVLCYVPAATVSGAINDRAADTSKIGLIAHGGNWISSGFVAMCVATIVAVAVTGLRMFQDVRAHPRTPRGSQPSSRGASPRLREDSGRPRGPEPGRPDPGRPEPGRPDATGPSRPSTPAGTGHRRPAPGTGPRRPAPGTGPYGAPPAIAPPAIAPPPAAPPAIGPGRRPGPSPRPGPGPDPRGTGGSRPRPGTNPYPPPQYPSGRGDRYNFSSGA